MDKTSRFCFITFDEMSLRQEMKYDASKDSVTGLVQLPTKEPQACNQALVFMIKGITAKWKQPLSFYFSHNAAPAKSLKILLDEVIRAVRNASFNPLAVVCDQGSGNRALYRVVGVQENSPFFEVLRFSVN